MVFCRQCKQKVHDCSHFVYPIPGQRIPVFDPKVESLAYEKTGRVLEIAFKNGQTWQLEGVSQEIFTEIQNSTISSFLKMIGHRYKASPVKRGMAAVIVPESEKCPKCRSNMAVERKTGSDFDQRVRIFWRCAQCQHDQFNDYHARYSPGGERGRSH